MPVGDLLLRDYVPNLDMIRSSLQYVCARCLFLVKKSTDFEVCSAVDPRRQILLSRLHGNGASSRRAFQPVKFWSWELVKAFMVFCQGCGAYRMAPRNEQVSNSVANLERHSSADILLETMAWIVNFRQT